MAVDTYRLPSFLQPPKPSVFTFEITPRCQHRCLGCGNVFAHTGQELSAADWEKIINNLAPSIQALRLTGGEPTLHREFAKILRMVDNLGKPFVLFTNGNWINPAETLRLLCACQNLRGLLVSLHGADPTSYQRFTGVDGFEKTAHTLQAATTAGLKVSTNTLLLTTTFEQIENIATFAFLLGAATASFGRYYGPPIEHLSLNIQQLKSALTTIASLHRRDERIILSNCVPFCFLPGLDFGGGGCTSGFTHCTVGPYGEVRPCTHTDLVLGHLPEEQIDSIWAGKALRVWRNRVPSHCLSCKAFSSCRGGCRAFAQQLNLTHDPLYVHPIEHLEPELVSLYTDDRPRLACQVVMSDNGYSLSAAGRYIRLTLKSKRLLQFLDGEHTIEEMQVLFGEESLKLVASLYKRQMLILGE